VNPLILAVFAVLFIALFALLARWQRRIDETRTTRTVDDIREAKRRGSDKALAQHPLIDSQACIGCGTCIAACPEDEVIGLVDGVAHIVHGSRCIGHGLCAVACPVAAIEIGLGELAGRPDIPVLSETLETSVPGVYIAGELGGFALIRVAVEQGVRTVDQIARELRAAGRRDSSVADVLIVGAGPAGFAAALRSIELGLSYVLIDQDDLGGSVRKYPRRKLTLTGRLALPLHGEVRRKEFLKEELIEFWDGLARKHGVELRSSVRFEELTATGDHRVAATSAGPIAARRVILALGRRGTPRKLGVPGEEQEKVLYQLIDAASFRDEHILIAGGGDSAIEAATGLANQPGNTVTLSYRRADFFRLKSRNEERIRDYAAGGRVRLLMSSSVAAIGRDSATLCVQVGGVESRIEIPNDYTFVFAGGVPPYPLLSRIGVRFNAGAEESERSETVAHEIWS
jgi:thioredoxin reductase